MTRRRQRSPRWKRRPEERRAEIVEAAVQVFGQAGFRRATLGEIAARAGVCPGTVSHYFGSKAQLFEEVIAERFVHFVASEEALLAAHRGPARPLLQELLGRLWSHAWTPGTLELVHVMQVEAAEFEESGRLLFQQLSERWRRLLGSILTKGMRAGEFRSIDVDLAARTISYAVMGVAQRVSAVVPFDPTLPDRDVMWRSLLGMVERFILVDPPAEQRARRAVLR
jgi:AcrR family transcriptional regulator